MTKDNQNNTAAGHDDIIGDVTNGEYKYGFVSDIDTDVIPRGLNEDVIRLISKKKGEPEWLLEFRLKAYRHWLTLKMPTWAHLDIPEIDYQAISYYAAPKKKEGPKSLDEVDPELLETFNKLGIPLEEQKALSGMAVDAVMDSVSVKTTHREKLAEMGVIFCSFSEAVKDYPDLVKRYLGTVVSYRDNFFAALNSAVFSDGSFVYIPKGVRCPMELSTYFRINASGTGQFERTLIVADDDAYVSYLEGCTAPMRDENQLHAAIVEIIVEDRAEVKYSTVQNWYAGDKQGNGGVYNFVTKRGLCRGDYSKLSWTQVETGSAITWKYPGCVLAGEGGRVLLGCRDQQLSAGRHRHKDDSPRTQHPLDNRQQGYLGRPQPELLSRTGKGGAQSRRMPQLHAVRQSSAQFTLRSPHIPLHRCAQRHRRSGA